MRPGTYYSPGLGDKTNGLIDSILRSWGQKPSKVASNKVRGNAKGKK
jgi:hypothetical protein